MILLAVSYFEVAKITLFGDLPNHKEISLGGEILLE